MQCPNCKKPDTKVIDSREAEEGKVIRRRRECEACGRRYTTFERIELGSLMVKKRDGSMEPYSRAKLENGVWIACGKRPVTDEQVDKMMNNLENMWRANKKSISSEKIGNDVSEALKKIDHVAYIRFASVYRSFKDVDEFKEEISKLLK